jgi:hypothetical protein
VATVTTLMVAACFLVERSLSRLAKVTALPARVMLGSFSSLAWNVVGDWWMASIDGSTTPLPMQWLRKTKRKAMLAALEKIREGIPTWRFVQSSLFVSTVLFHAA